MSILWDIETVTSRVDVIKMLFHNCFLFTLSFYLVCYPAFGYKIEVTIKEGDVVEEFTKYYAVDKDVPPFGYYPESSENTGNIFGL